MCTFFVFQEVGEFKWTGVESRNRIKRLKPMYFDGK